MSKKNTSILEAGEVYLTDEQVRRYAGLDRITIARTLKCSTQTVREVLNGRERATGPKATEVLNLAEKMVLKSL